MTDKVSRTLFAFGSGFLVLALVNLLDGTPAVPSLESLAYPIVLFTAAGVYEAMLRVRWRLNRAAAARAREEL